MFIEILLGIGLLFLWLYRYTTKQFDVFKKQGIPFSKPSFPFGSPNAKEVMMGKKNFFEADHLPARGEFKDERIWGYFMMGQPILVINDEELAKHILIKDFDHFTDVRSFGYENEKRDGKLIKYMFTNMKGERWKKVRSMMSGVFTSGKLKLMMPFLVECADNMEEYLANLESKGEEFEVRDVASMFTLDAFASAGFGIENNSFANPDNAFRKMGMTIAGAPGYSSGWDTLRMIFISVAPGIAKILGIPNLAPKPVEFFYNVIEKTYAEREKTGKKRNDIIDCVLEEMKKSQHMEEFKEDLEPILVANALMYFLAGFDTQAITLSQVFHNLVKNPDVQDKLIDAIDESLEKSDGKITYEMIEECQYLDWTIKEAMRYKMLFVAHERVCTKDYKIPETDFVIPKDRLVHLWIEPIINNPKNYVNPDNFDPQNFNPDNFTNKFANLAFGQGPRACPGIRYAYLAVKIFITKLFQKYKVVPCEKTNMGVATLDPTLMFAIEGGIWVKLQKR